MLRRALTLLSLEDRTTWLGTGSRGGGSVKRFTVDGADILAAMTEADVASQRQQCRCNTPWCLSNR